MAVSAQNKGFWSKAEGFFEKAGSFLEEAGETGRDILEGVQGAGEEIADIGSDQPVRGQPGPGGVNVTGTSGTTGDASEPGPRGRQSGGFPVGAILVLAFIWMLFQD